MRFPALAIFGALSCFCSLSLSAASGAPACANAGALGTSRVMAVSGQAGLHVGMKSYAQTLALKDREVVLTFDDGPLPGPTGRVLDALKAECARATFFLIGRNAQANPHLVRRELAEGHTIAHHSWSHPRVTLRGLSGPAAIRDIQKGIAAVEKAAYGTNYQGGAPRVPFFRFPGFADSQITLDWLDRNRIVTFGTDVWASDWVRMSPAAGLGLVMRRLERRRRGIILFHDTQAVTAAMLPRFLRMLKSRGYKLVHLVPGGTGATPLEKAGQRWRSETEAILARIMPRLSGKRRKKR